MSLNPLLPKIQLPGRVFQLPSKGLFYPPGVLNENIKDGEIEVKPMSALTELKIRSADLLYSTKIIKEICEDCAPEILKPEALLTRDVDALFMFLLATTYGSTKTIRSLHDCEKADWHDYDINLDEIISEPNNKMLEHRETHFKCELSNGQIVKLKPLSFLDSVEQQLMRTAIAKKEVEQETVTHQDMERLIISDLMAVIESVQSGDVTVTDKNHIIEWLKKLPKSMVDKIVLASQTASEWGYNFNRKIVCKDCGKPYMHDLELNPVNFFTG